MVPVYAALPTAAEAKADVDGDGSNTPADCDDSNPNVYPGAPETDNLTDDDCDGWVDEDFVAAGDLVITEINRQARFGASVVNRDGSWVEVYNGSSRTVDLANWVVARGTSSSGNAIYLDPASAPVLAPGEYAVFCDTDNYQGSAASWPLTCDYVWGDETQAASYRGTYHDNTFYLRRDDDYFQLYVGGSRTTGTLIDQVHWTYDATNGYWPRDARYSTSLDPDYIDASTNDNRSAWCSTSSSATGTVSNNTAWRWYDTSGTNNDEHGTPGAANYNCLTTNDLDGDSYTTTTDCNDGNASVYPGATETCNGVDDDCDGIVDDGTGTTMYYPDTDGDGYGASTGGITACSAPSGYVTNGADCDDGDATINPAATETCDGVDQDCDGTADDGVSTGSNVFYEDADADSYGNPDSSTTACTAPSGYVDDDTDCDDLDPDVSPGDPELDNEIDDDCDGAIDEDFILAGDIVVTEINRQARFGGSTTVNDGSWVEVYNNSARTIDLSNWTIARGTTSGEQVAIDPAAALVLAPGDYAVFCDSDNYQGSAVSWPLTCSYVWGDETQGSTYAGTYHNNVWYLRRDSDAFSLYAGGDRTTGTLIDQVAWAWDATNGYWPRDARFSASLDPAYLDGTLNDDEAYWCSTTASSTGAVSNNTSWRWWDTSSTSNDEHGTPGAANYDCQSDLDGDGYSTTDCDDGDASVNPGATEVCDGVDNDCDGSIDEAGATGGSTWYADADGDGYGDAAASTTACSQPSGYVADGTDCDDGDATAYPGATEVCDGLDNDCDGSIDEGTTASTWYADADGDSYGDDATALSTCSPPAGYVTTGGDCDDAAASVNPGAEEVCNDGLDNDCDASTTCYWSSSQKVSDNYDFRCYGDVVNYAVGTSIANNGDYDGDGYDDVVVGQMYWDVSPYADQGRVNVFYGPVNDTQLIGDADFTIQGETSRGSDQFGNAARFASDMDGDGMDELLIGAWKAGTSDTGSVYLFQGGTAASGVADAYATFNATESSANLGQAISTGDMDLDGADDVALGAYLASSNAGRVGVWGATDIGGGAEDLQTQSTVLFTGVASGDNLGFSLAMDDDLDGDGSADLVMGAPAQASTTAAGAVYIYYGVDTLSGSLSASTADAILTGAAAADRLGYAVATLGDTNGDGFGDFVVTADRNDSSATNAGAVYVYTTDPSGTAAVASGASTVIRGEVAEDVFGRSVASIGDIDDDGGADMLVGATAWDLGSISGAGAAYLFYGPFSSGTVSASTFDARFTGSNTADAVGYAVSGRGDVNADGYADFMISAPSWDAFGLLNGGGSWLYYGGVE